MNLDSINTNANGHFKNSNKFEERKASHQTVLNSINSHKAFQTSMYDINESDADSMDSPSLPSKAGSKKGRARKEKEQDIVVHEGSGTKDLFLVGEDPVEKRQFQEMRVAYLKHSSFLSCSALCCFKPFLFCADFGDVCLEIALFKRSYRPDESI